MRIWLYANVRQFRGIRNVCLWHATQVRFCRWFVANLAINWNAIPPNAVEHFLIKRINIPPVRHTRMCTACGRGDIWKARAHTQPVAASTWRQKQQLKWLFDRLIDVLIGWPNARINKPCAWGLHALRCATFHAPRSYMPLYWCRASASHPHLFSAP